MLAVWIAVRWEAPPLRIVQERSTIKIDLSTLSEYPTTIRQIRLSVLSRAQLIWELRANEENAQIHGFPLKEGQNPVQVDSDYGKYTVISPKDASTFLLRTGAAYKLELWGGNSIFTKKSIIFHLGG